MSLDVPRFAGVAALSIALCCGCSDRQAVIGAKPEGRDATTDAGTTVVAPEPPAGPEPAEGVTKRQPDAATATTIQVAHASVATEDGGASDPHAREPYANVTAVGATGTNGAVRLRVSIESADVGCSRFADWWEVLSLDGELLYRRVLTHSHTDANGTTDVGAPGNTFTRDGGPIAIETATAVIVRAHMSHGGYRGQVMRGSADSGFDAAPDLPLGFASDVEGLPPLPSSCSF